MLTSVLHAAGKSADPWSSPIVSGSGWLLTLAGTGVAVFTLYQVRSKNSAFRRALILTAKHRSHRELRSVTAQLTTLSSKLIRVTAEGNAAKAIAQEWMRVASESKALHELSVADDPLRPDRPGRRWQTKQGKRFGAAAAQVRVAAAGAATRPAESDLLEAIERSNELAAEFLLEPSATRQNEFSHAASVAVSRLTYECRRLTYVEIGDLHDDR